MLKELKALISVWQNKLAKYETVGLSDRRLNLARKKLESVLSGIFGYHALLYSDKSKKLVSEHLSVRNAMVISNRLNECDLVCRYEELPIASDCIDLLVLPDILQRSSTPHQILRECERVLIPEGHIILLVSNSLSWLTIKNRFIHFLTQQKERPRTISRFRLNDWFRLLGFESVAEIPVCITDDKIQKRHYYSWFKKLSKLGCDYFAGYFIIVAKKKVSTMTPIRPSWRRNKKLVNPRLTEPSVNSHVDNCVKQIMQ